MKYAVLGTGMVGHTLASKLASLGHEVRMHNPAYNFNDDVIPAGVSYWARLVETSMPAATA